MKIKKLTAEDGEVKFEIYQTSNGFDFYTASLSLKDAQELKADLAARDDI